MKTAQWLRAASRRIYSASWEPSHTLVHDAQCTFHDIPDVEIFSFSSIVSKRPEWAQSHCLPFTEYKLLTPPMILYMWSLKVHTFNKIWPQLPNGRIIRAPCLPTFFKIVSAMFCWYLKQDLKQTPPFRDSCFQYSLFIKHKLFIKGRLEWVPSTYFGGHSHNNLCTTKKRNRKEFCHASLPS